MEILAAVGVCGGLAVCLFWLVRNARRERRLCAAERALHEEFEAYARVDVTLAPGEAPREVARRACAAVAKHSRLGQAALLLRDAELRLQVMGSAGVDDLMVLALDAWGERFAREQRGERGGGGDARREAGARRKNYAVTVGPLEAFDVTGTCGLLGCRQVTVLPLWSSAGAMLGALVCGGANGRLGVDAALTPLEALAAMLARSVENAALSDRLLRAEKMAGLGQLATGVAHELNNPLTAVLGFAELIAETSTEARVREDAQMVVTEAVRMKNTVESLLQFWRPVTPSDRAVDVVALLQRIETRAVAELAPRGVKFVLQMDADTGACCVRGHEARLLEVFEHLLSNAAQAVSLPIFGLDEPRAIRVTLACEAKTLQVVVSDTGAGFREPGRVFDPFYTTRQPGEGQGMGLAMSYGIVREHGGEISAFNLTPHGAAVVVELPLARVVRDSGEHAVVGV